MADPQVDPYLEETRMLKEMSDEDRTTYVVGVIEWLSSRIKWILSAKKKAQMMRRFSQITDEADGRGEELMVCALWTIKAEFREPWMELLGTLVEMDKKNP